MIAAEMALKVITKLKSQLAPDQFVKAEKRCWGEGGKE